MLLSSNQAFPKCKKRSEWLSPQFEEEHIQFYEIYVKTSIQTCEMRDPKGLYSKYRQGEDIKLSGLTEPYEEPDCPFVVCDTDKENLNECASKILKAINCFS